MKKYIEQTEIDIKTFIIEIDETDLPIELKNELDNILNKVCKKNDLFIFVDNNIERIKQIINRYEYLTANMIICNLYGYTTIIKNRYISL